MTTIAIPSRDHHTERCETMETASIPLNNTIKVRQNQKVLRRKSNTRIVTHVIGSWVIRESLEPFQQQENSLLTSRKQEQHILSDNTNVHQWSVSN